MTKLKLIGLGILILLLGAAIGRLTAPKKIEEKERIIYEEKEKEVRTIEERIIVRENKDGTKETITEKDVKEDIERSKDGMDFRSKTESKDIDWNVSLLAVKPKERDLSNAAYGVHIQRTILGSISAGIYADTTQTVAVSIGISF